MSCWTENFNLSHLQCCCNCFLLMWSRWPGLLQQFSCIQFHLFRVPLSTSNSGICPFLISLVTCKRHSNLSLSSWDSVLRGKVLSFQRIALQRWFRSFSFYMLIIPSPWKEQFKKRKNREMAAAVSVKILWQLSPLTGKELLELVFVLNHLLYSIRRPQGVDKGRLNENMVKIAVL